MYICTVYFYLQINTYCLSWIYNVFYILNTVFYFVFCIYMGNIFKLCIYNVQTLRDILHFNILQFIHIIG